MDNYMILIFFNAKNLNNILFLIFNTIKFIIFLYFYYFIYYFPFFKNIYVLDEIIILFLKYKFKIKI